MIAVAPSRPDTDQLPLSPMSSITVLALPTATLADALLPPAVAVTPVRPVPLPAAVNRPLADTSPSDGSATDQDAARGVTRTGDRSAAVPLSVSRCACPLPRSGEAGVTVSESRVRTTSIRCTDLALPSRTISSPAPERLAVNWPRAQVPREPGTTGPATVPAAGLASASVA